MNEGTNTRLKARLARAHKLAGHALKSQDERRVNAMVRLARSIDGVAIGHRALDAHPWLFNCDNGTIDLRTGVLSPHSRAHLLTKLCPTRYDPAAPCPVWERTLAAVFDGKAELVDYFRRLCGYSMTGDVSEQLLPVFWGAGSNGKSLLFEVVRSVLGTDYATPGARELLDPREDAHPTFKADLFGMRLVTLAETREGGRINEALIKELTGGEAVKARRMREDNWEFTPTHKFWLATNHRPEVRGTDDGIWRRLRLIPFTVRFWDRDKNESGPPHLRADKTLKGKLLAEAEGILAWMVRGCLEWQSGGMREPKEVTLATAAYRSEQNTVERFVRERCEVGEGSKERASALYAAFKKWHEEYGEEGRPMSQRRFGQGLAALGFHSRASNGTLYEGIALRAADGEIGGAP
jgi:putative DNA primase/helicase